MPPRFESDKLGTLSAGNVNMRNLVGMRKSTDTDDRLYIHVSIDETGTTSATKSSAVKFAAAVDPVVKATAGFDPSTAETFSILESENSLNIRNVGTGKCAIVESVTSKTDLINRTEMKICTDKVRLMTVKNVNPTNPLDASGSFVPYINAQDGASFEGVKSLVTKNKDDSTVMYSINHTTAPSSITFIKTISGVPSTLAVLR